MKPPSSGERNELPAGWARADVSDVASVDGGLTRNATKRSKAKTRVPLVSVAAVQRRLIDESAVGSIGLLESDGDRATLQRGDILVVEGNGSLAHIGRVALWDRDIPAARHQNHIIRVRAGDDVQARFLIEWLASPRGRSAIISKAASSSGLYTLSLSKVSGLPCPVAPLNEQRRIVAKIESLFARSRRANTALDAIPPLLDKLRQSILAAAFRGDLTEDWRARNTDVEPADKLLERIRVERRHRWEEAQLAKMQAKGKEPKNDKWKAKYKEPAAPLVSTDALLPPTWCWSVVDELSTRVTDGTHQAPPLADSGIPFVLIGNVIDGRIDWSRIRKWVTPETHEQLTARCPVERGDVLYTAVGATFGRALVVETDEPFIFQRHIAQVKPLTTLVNSHYLSCVLNAPQSYTVAKRHARGGAQPTVTLGDLKRFPIPVPPAPEQEIIVERVRLALDAVLSLGERHLATAVLQASLDASILARAFRGELVEQDPSDEPASVLLERIRSARDAATPVKKKRSGKRRVGGKKTAIIEAD